MQTLGSGPAAPIASLATRSLLTRPVRRTRRLGLRAVRPDRAAQRRLPGGDHQRLLQRRDDHHQLECRRRRQFKPGRYTTAITDHEVGLAGLPLQVVRSYDSFDKTRGDFGVGWNVDLADFRVAVSAPLGLKGWTASSGSCGLMFCNIVYSSTVPHYVTVVWPDGHQEMFDLKPTEGSTFFPGLSNAVFVPHPGTATTSTLEVAGDNSLFFNNDGNANGGAFGSDGIFDPTTFKLTDRSGVQYLIDRTGGLQKITDPTGNNLTVTHDGLISSQGSDQSISYKRDDLDRITKITSPEGQSSYTYEDGNLKTVTDPAGHQVTYTYGPNHNLTGSTGEAGHPRETIEYGPDGRISAITDGEGNRTEMSTDIGARTLTTALPGGREIDVTSYDERGNQTQVDRLFHGAHHLTRYHYNNLDEPTRREDPDGHVWQASYDDVGRPTVLTDARGKTTRFENYTQQSLPQLITDEVGHQTHLTYDPATGQLVAVTDADGNTQHWTYNDDGTVATYQDGSQKADGTPREWDYTYVDGHRASENDPAGKVTRYEYNPAGLTSAVVDPTGVRTEYQYDALGNLRFVTEPLGRTTEYRYDPLSRLTDVADAEGRDTSYTYYDNGRLHTISDLAGEATTYTYTPRGLLDTATNAESDTTSYTYDGGGRLTQTKDGVGRTTGYTYDPADRITSRTDPNGAVTQYKYDPNGRMTDVVDALNGTTQIGYDDTGRTRSLTDPLQHTTTYGYSDAGRPVSTTDPLQHTTSYSYDPAGRLATSTDPLQHSTRYSYDPAGRLAQVTDPENRTTGYTYDDAGRPRQVTDGLNRTSTLNYDAGGWLDTITTAAGATDTYTWDKSGLLHSEKLGANPATLYSYDPAGRLHQLTNPRGYATTWDHDHAGRVTSETDAADAVTAFGYDHAGQLTKLTDALNRVTEFTYDPLGNLATRTDPLKREWSWTYDALGRPDLQTDPKGQVIDQDFDAASRPAKTTTPDGVITYSYDAADRLQSTSDTSGSVGWTYDAADRPTQVTSPAGTIGYTWDNAGLLTDTTLPTGTIHRTYDAAGNLDRVTNWTGAWTDYDMNGDGQPATITRANGISTDYGYDPAGRLAHITDTRSGNTPDHFDYTLDPNGNRITETSNAGTTRWTLDKLDRLTNATYPGGHATGYTYLADGSRDTATVDGQTSSYRYDPAGQLASINGPNGTRTYAYDQDGNRTRAGDTTYTYDSLNQLTSTTTGTTTHHWTYAPDGLRATTDSTRQLWDRLPSGPGDVAHLAAASDTSYIHNPFGGVDTSITGGATTWALTDALGSTRALTDSTGAVIGAAGYDAFGAVTSATGDQSPFGFAGEQTDPNGLLNLRARNYDTTTGQFLQADTLLRSMFGTVGFNTYTYAGDNPATLTDPTGHAAAAEEGELLGGITVPEDAAGQALGRCAEGALTDMAMGLVLGGASPASSAVDAVTGCASGAKPPTPPKSGIYIVNAAKGVYVGQSKNIARRFAQHVRAGKFTQAEVDNAARQAVSGGKLQREIAEQNMIDRMGGIKNLLNEVNPIGPKRFHMMPIQPYMR